MKAKNLVHIVIFSILFSLLGWTIVNKLLISIDFWIYYVIEILVLALGKAYGVLLKRLLDGQPET